MKKVLSVMTAVVLTVASVAGYRALPPSATAAGGDVLLTALSTDPNLVTGGDVLLQVSVPPGTPRGDLKVTAGARDVTPAFKPGRHPDTFLGLVSDLPVARAT